MSIDPPANWRHADALDRGEDPRGQIPEVTAASKIADLLGKHQDPRWLTPAALQYQAGKIVAHRVAIAAVFDQLDADPKRLPERGDVLRQQVTSSLEDRDFFLEQAAYHLAGYRDACAVLSRMDVPRDLWDPDARDQDREDDRAREQRQDEAAVEAMPKVRAS